ncbi:hypothetical protein Bbelb_185890 [Branchiostoma belcheri]|nr:hypothetical protein Bbelb_185890 [Branchiostoma belcheri]
MAADSSEPCTFKPHNSSCTICYGNATDDHSYHTKQQRGRKRKTTHAGPGRPRKKESPATEKSQTESDIESSATNISHASTQTNTTSRTDSGTQTDTSTCGYIVDAENPDVSDIPLPVLCNFVKAAAQSQRRSIQQDTSGIAGLHKEPQTLSNIDPATYYSNRNSLCTSFVDGLVDQKTTVSSKVMTVEQIYHVVSPVLVAPFTFTRNLLCYAATNSKLVVNMLGKVSAGGMIETVKTYLDNMATKPLPFPKGDSEVAIDNDQKWPTEGPSLEGTPQAGAGEESSKKAKPPRKLKIHRPTSKFTEEDAVQAGPELMKKALEEAAENPIWLIIDGKKPTPGNIAAQTAKELLETFVVSQHTYFVTNLSPAGLAQTAAWGNPDCIRRRALTTGTTRAPPQYENDMSDLVDILLHMQNEAVCKGTWHHGVQHECTVKCTNAKKGPEKDNNSYKEFVDKETDWLTSDLGCRVLSVGRESSPLMLLLAPRGHAQMMVLQRSEDTVPTGVGILEGINNDQLYLEAVQRDRQRILESRCLRQEQDAEIWQQLGTDQERQQPVPTSGETIDQLQGHQQPVPTSGETIDQLQGRQQPVPTGETIDQLQGRQQPVPTSGETIDQLQGRQQPVPTSGETIDQLQGRQQPVPTGETIDQLQGRQQPVPTGETIDQLQGRQQPVPTGETIDQLQGRQQPVPTGETIDQLQGRQQPAEEQLPSGKFWQPTEAEQKKSEHVPTTNVVSERDFAVLDNLLRAKPYASSLSCEACVWKTHEEVKEKLGSLHREQEKLDALKHQLQFHKKVLKSEGNKELFQMTNSARTACFQ